MDRDAVNPVYEVVDIAARRRPRTTRGSAGGGIHGGVTDSDATDRAWRRHRVHSATKYLNGHSDVLAGVLLPRRGPAHLGRHPSRNARSAARRLARSKHGSCCAACARCICACANMRKRTAMNCAAAARSIRGANASLSRLPYHKQHEIAPADAGGFGGMMSFEVKGGAAGALGVISRLKLVKVRDFARRRGDADRAPPIDRRATVRCAGGLLRPQLSARDTPTISGPI